LSPPMAAESLTCSLWLPSISFNLPCHVLFWASPHSCDCLPIWERRRSQRYRYGYGGAGARR
jgi:hypothetical protein